MLGFDIEVIIEVDGFGVRRGDRAMDGPFYIMFVRSEILEFSIKQVLDMVGGGYGCMRRWVC